MGAASRRLASIEEHARSPELQALIDAANRASAVFNEVEQGLRAWTDGGREPPALKSVWERSREFRSAVHEVRQHAIAIHEDERRRAKQRAAQVEHLLNAHARPHPDPVDDPSGEDRDRLDLDAALADAERRFQAARQSFDELRAAHAAGLRGDTELWKRRIADFREAMAAVHRLVGDVRQGATEFTPKT